MRKLNQTLSFDVSKEGNGKVKNEKKCREMEIHNCKVDDRARIQVRCCFLFSFFPPPTPLLVSRSPLPAFRSPLSAPRFPLPAFRSPFHSSPSPLPFLVLVGVETLLTNS